MINKMMDYLSSSFKTLEQLSLELNISDKEIEYMINNKLIPDYAYLIDSNISIKSPLYPDGQLISNSCKYFHKSHFAWIILVKQLLDSDNNLEIVKDRIFNKFRNEYLSLLKQNIYNHFNYDNLLDLTKDNIIIEKFDIHFQEIYNHWLSGIFGVCVKSPDCVSNIFYKSFYQAQLSNILQNRNIDDLTTSELNILRNISAKYAEYVSDFSPIDYHNSSKKRFVDDVLLYK